MTKLDYIVFGLLLISAIVGFARGAVREIAAVTALVLAAAAAVLGLKFTTPIAAHIAHPHWVATAVALLVAFGVVYIVLRLVGAGLARRIQRTDVLGALDRTIGLLIGGVRGLVVLGALYLMFNAATPEDLQPKWIVQSRTWPLAADMGRLIEGLAPQGMDLASRLKPALDRAVGDTSGDRNATDGYDARQRGEIDDLVEKSR